MLKPAILFLALAAPIAIATPVTPLRAATLDTLRCVPDQIDSRTRYAISREMEKNLATPDKQPGFKRETMAVLQQAAGDCQNRYTWSSGAASAAMTYTISKLAWPGAVKVATANGLNPDLILARVAALTPAEKADATSGTVMTKLINGGKNAGEITDANQALAVAIYSLLANQEKALADFQKL